MGTPKEIIATLNKLTNEYLTSDIGKQQLESADMQAAGGNPGRPTEIHRREAGKWGPIIKAAGMDM